MFKQDYKKMYKDMKEIASRQFRNMSKEKLKERIEKQFIQKDFYTRHPKAIEFWRLVTINAHLAAIGELKKEMHAKGLNIYGEPLKKQETNINAYIDKQIKPKGRF